MKTRIRGPLFYVFIFILFFVMIRFAPLVFRALQLLLVGLRVFWLPLAVILIAAAVFRFFKKRKKAAVESSEENRKLRDVTNSVQDE